MGTIGPKPNPKPVILHVDSDTNIPYRLAESDVLVVSSITASSYNNLPTNLGATSVTQLAGTGVFATTATNVSSFAGTGVLATLTYVNSNFPNNAAIDTQLEQYVGPYGSPSTGEVPYWDGSKWNGAVPGIDGDVLTLDSGVPAWLTPAGVISTPVAINLGGTNATGTPVTSGVIYYNGTRYATVSNLTFNGSVLAAPSLTLTNSLAVAQGGTGVTALGNLNLTSLGGTLSVAKGGTNSTTQQNNGVLHFNNATTAITSVTSFTFNGTTLAAPALSLTTALPVNSGGTGQTTLATGNFLIGNGTSQVTLTPTATFETTATAASKYFNKTTDVLPVSRGGTSSTSYTARGLLYYNGTDALINGDKLRIGTTSKLLCSSGIAIPSKQLFTYNGVDDNPATEFKLTDIPDVNATGPSNNQVLTWNTATSKWVAQNPAASAPETWTTVYLQSNVDTNVTSLQNTNLTFSVNSASSYIYEIVVFFDAFSTEKIDFAVNSPTVTNHYWNIDYTSPAAGFGNKRCLAGTGSLSRKNGTVDTNGNGSIGIQGIITPSADGSVTFQFSVTTASGSKATIYKGSYLKYTKAN
jgi:hypothetical protein